MCGFAAISQRPSCAGKVAIGVTELLQAPVQQREVIGLLGRHLDPIRVVTASGSAEPVDRVACQVDRVELDVRDRVRRAARPSRLPRPRRCQLARADQNGGAAAVPASQVDGRGQIVAAVEPCGANHRQGLRFAALGVDVTTLQTGKAAVAASNRFLAIGAVHRSPVTAGRLIKRRRPAIGIIRPPFRASTHPARALIRGFLTLETINLRRHYSRNTLLRMILLAPLAAGAAVWKFDLINAVYFKDQLTATGLVINGAILALFLLGLLRTVGILLSYMGEGRSTRFVRNVDKRPDLDPLKVSVNTMIARRYATMRRLHEARSPINQNALAATLVASETPATVCRASSTTS